VRGGGRVVEVFPEGALASSSSIGTLPPMAGRCLADGDDVCFVPRFPFVARTAYCVRVDGTAVGILARPSVEPEPTTEVVAIHPTAAEVPRNLLRLYVWFSAPMAEGAATEHLVLVDDDDVPLAAPLLAMDQELWDGDRRRLTVLLDPARIKRGLVPHRAVGYPLEAGRPFRVVVGDGFRDAAGARLRASAGRRYAVGPDERRRVDPTTWRLTAMPDQLTVAFDRPLDHGLLLRCLRVLGPGGRIGGTVSVADDACSWRFTPAEPWTQDKALRLEVDPRLEDLAGNSVTRVFDRALDRPGDDPGPAAPVVLSFDPSRAAP
jgi:hypothetical protein